MLDVSRIEIKLKRPGTLHAPQPPRPHSLRPLLLPEQDDSATVLAEYVKSQDFKTDLVGWDGSDILDYTDTFMTPSTRPLNGNELRFAIVFSETFRLVPALQ